MQPEKHESRFPDPKFEVELRGRYAAFRHAGILDKSGYVALIDFMVRSLRENGGILRCLVDLRDSESRIDTLERYELARLSAERLPGIRMATLVSKLLNASALYENAANNRGLTTLVTDDEEKAVGWLSE